MTVVIVIIMLHMNICDKVVNLQHCCDYYHKSSIEAINPKGYSLFPEIGLFNRYDEIIYWFESINYPYIAYINGSEVRYQGEIRSTEKQDLICDTSLCPDVFVMKLYPGTKPELFDYLKHLYKGVIVESFGSGGIPLQGRNLLPKLKELIDSGIAVVITTQCLEEGEDLSLYKVGRKIAAY
jgi:L-asparaginase/Glu-tRNA(Gln) amidotransferase subunit D